MRSSGTWRWQIFPLVAVMSWISISETAAQDTLPSFTAALRSGKTIISWTNPYEKVVQISIQRSADSLYGFRTILTMPDPNVPVNGYLDATAPDTLQYYRIYIQLPYGRFFQSVVKRPKEQKIITPVYEQPVKQEMPSPVNSYRRPVRRAISRIKTEAAPAESQNDYIEINRRTKVVYVKKQAFRYLKPGDPMAVDMSELEVTLPANIFKPSTFLFTNKEGNVVIAMPGSSAGKISVFFYFPDKSPAFQIRNLSEPVVILDKSNFQRSGWFEFELYQDGKLKEKNRLFIPKSRL